MGSKFSFTENQLKTSNIIKLHKITNRNILQHLLLTI